MFFFVSIRVFSWLTNLPAAEGGLAKNPCLSVKSVACLSVFFMAKKKQPQAAFPY